MGEGAESTKMKPLSEKQARSCEEAKDPVCKCRCGGRLHGARRGGDNDTPRSFFEGLPEDDPHYLPSAAKVAEAEEKRKEEKRRERDEMYRRRWDALRELASEK